MITPIILICHPQKEICDSLKSAIGIHYPFILTTSHEHCLDCLANNQKIKLLFIAEKFLDLTAAHREKEFPSVKIISISDKLSIHSRTISKTPSSDHEIFKPFHAEEIFQLVSKIFD